MGSEPASSSSSEQPIPPLGQPGLHPPDDNSCFSNAALVNHKLKTRDPHDYLTKHRPVEKVVLYGDKTESSIVSDSFRHALGTAIVSIFKSRKGKFAFRHPLDLRSWRVNAFGGFEVANGTPIIKKASEYDTMHDFYELGVFAEFCLLHFGGVIPEQFSKLIEKLKNPTTDKGYAIMVDPCLVPTHLWSLAFLDAFHTVMHLMSQEDRELILKKLDVHCQGWKADMLLNQLSKCYVMFIGPDETLKTRGEDSSRAFLECIRHALAHPLDYIGRLERLGFEIHSKQDLYKVLREKGGDRLLSLLFDLLPVKYVKKLALEWYLCREHSSCCPYPTNCIRRVLRKHDLCRLDPATVNRLTWLKMGNKMNEQLFVPSGVLNTWKVLYSENGPALKEFWDMCDTIKRHSVWTCEGNDDIGNCHAHEMVNKTCGLMMHMYPCRSYSFGRMIVMGPKTGPYKVKGVWVFPGAEVPRFLMNIHGMDFYSWTKVDISIERQKTMVDDSLSATVVHQKSEDSGHEEVVSAICF
ncbi:uncharacterized protein LOC125541002 [Triticum urartu]|uniref:uncharacterized protein LOC125541002 n=1 Tax=Triticum urartu TaxID=4572 RepID=UPI002044A73F|nr:uncharacterized protein LOC125541002 [Triticum urartu]